MANSGNGPASHILDNNIVPATTTNNVERQHSHLKPEIQQLENNLISPVSSLPVWKSLKVSDGDTALALFDNVEQLHEVVDPVEEKKLIRKIDVTIIPCLAVCYAFYYASSSNSQIHFSILLTMLVVD